MAFFQIENQDLQKHINPIYLQNRLPLTKESIQQNLKSFLEFKYKQVIQYGDQRNDQTQQLQNIFEYSKQLKDKFEQSQKLQQKLRDIEDDLQNFFQCKENFLDIIQEYQQLFQEYEEMKQKVKEINQNDLPRIQAQQLLEDYNTIIKKLDDYDTFKNDLIDLQKIDKRFEMMELEEDYLEFNLIVNNIDSDQIKMQEIELLGQFVQMLGQSINYLKSPQNSTFIYNEDNKNISEEVLMKYKYAIIFKKYDMNPTLIIIDKEKSEVQVVCTSQNRSQNKLYLENYKNYLSNSKTNYILLKSDTILESTYTKIKEKLIQINIISQIRDLTFQDMQKIMKKFLSYQQGLEGLDYFQFLESMQIELN